MLKSISAAAAAVNASRRISAISKPHGWFVGVLPVKGIQHSECGRRFASAESEKSTGATPSPARAQWAVQENEAGAGRWNWLLRVLGFYTKESKGIRQSAMLYLSARAQAARPEFQRNLGVEESTSSRFYLECLHVWMILVRLRREGAEGKKLSQEIFDRFWEDMTKQLHSMGVKPIALNTRLRELQNAFYGCSVAYDYSLGNSDAILASALYRNMYGHECKASQLNQMVGYIRGELHALETMSTADFLDAQWKFGNPLQTKSSK